ncbi:Acyl-CoA thioester hydrolase YbgC [Hartmannibacter diazotrophicus]|uniref:Acyl-CoA thioester hydrolase YbgC n=2 Tax=Hartmannibacter diazotrophicus TaxID=1482074 RepID=A0A2C9DA33_9HYPH|nr:Acyl-CoA thioester hydrolase YbgC [Hartmannibacter diazotrophicus]
MVSMRPVSGELRDGAHHLPVRVYYEDTDAGGVLYHAGHIRFFERGRTEFLRAIGINQSKLNAAATEDRILFVVRKMTIEYLKPALLDDLLDVVTEVYDIAGPRITLKQELRREGEAIATADVLVISIGGNFRPVKLPQEMVDLMWSAGA